MNLQAYADPQKLPAGQPARVARLLAIREPDVVGDLQLARRISDGLHPAAVSALEDVLGSKLVIGPIISEATRRRARKAGKLLSRNLSERLYNIGRLVDAVSLVYHGDRHGIEAFLNRPHPLLDDESPFDVARSSSAGTEAVLNLVRRLEASVAV